MFFKLSIAEVYILITNRFKLKNVCALGRIGYHDVAILFEDL